MCKLIFNMNIDTSENRRIRTIAYLNNTIFKLKKVNNSGDFNGELEFLINIKDNLKNSLSTGHAKLIADILN